MTPSTIVEPQPVLAVTARAAAGAAESVIRDSVAALEEAARRLGIVAAGRAVRISHQDETVIEVCLPIAQLPADDPPPPIAAEVLVPGTEVAPVE